MQIHLDLKNMLKDNFGSRLGNKIYKLWLNKFLENSHHKKLNKAYNSIHQHDYYNRREVSATTFIDDIKNYPVHRINNFFYMDSYPRADGYVIHPVLPKYYYFTSGLNSPNGFCPIRQCDI